MGRLRELKIITFVGCPVCHARAGQACRGFRSGRPQVHPERKLAWQEDQRAHEPDMRLTPHYEGPEGQRTHYTLVAPQSAEALAWLQREAARPIGLHGDTRDDDPGDGWTWIGGALRVPALDIPALNRRIVEARWRTTGME